jgi:ABC-type bacteriocin/lantibiotic exporter with double-glycine peptidase domain
MPLSEHEQRILEEIERRLAEEDPKMVQRASLPLAAHLARRIKWTALAFCAGFVMLWLFIVSVWIALAGFVVMLLSGLLVYHYLKRLGRDQIQSWKHGGRFSLTAVLARMAERFRGPQGKSSSS